MQKHLKNNENSSVLFRCLIDQTGKTLPAEEPELLHEAALDNPVAITMQQRTTLAISEGKPLLPASR